METSVHGITAPSAVYEIAERRFEIGTRGFAEAIADAHAARQRPRCMCLGGYDGRGIEMYVARLGDGYIVKRMPETGSHHTPDCPSYEPPAEFSGLGQVLGSAITEDPATGETTLKLDFPLIKMPGHSQTPPAGGASDSVSSDGTKLSLRGLLHYLWDQAELTRWHPGFAGKRTWATVRKHLLQAAEHKLTRGSALRARLYVPEPFAIDQRDAINARRLAQWQHAVAAPRKPQHLVLMIGEVKEIVPARYGFKAIVKHVPDQGFAVDEHLFRRLGRQFNQELSLWGATDKLHMIMIATLAMNGSGLPAVVELSLMPVTSQWLPVKDCYDLELVERLERDGRSFIKALRYNLQKEQVLANAILTDAPDSPVPLFIAMSSVSGEDADSKLDPSPATDKQPKWIWQPWHGPMPPLPSRSYGPRTLLDTSVMHRA